MIITLQIYLLHNPDVSAKVRKEIDAVLGPQQMPSMQDRPNLPYTTACLHEIQRLSDVFPMSIPHATTEDVMFRGHLIPRNTMIIGFLYVHHRDSAIWEEPFSFKPERFLDANGKICNTEKLIPFSIGVLITFVSILSFDFYYLIYLYLLIYIPIYYLSTTNSILSIVCSCYDYEIL